MIKLEYIWLDGYTPEPNLRSKIKVVDSNDVRIELEKIPMWNFDGSSTLQAEGHDSDCILKPVRLYHSFNITDRVYVFCEVLNADGTPSGVYSNTRITDAASGVRYFICLG